MGRTRSYELLTQESFEARTSRPPGWMIFAREGGDPPWIAADRVWERIEPQAERRNRRPGRRGTDDRTVPRGVVCVPRAGIRWGSCPRDRASGRARRAGAGRPSGMLILLGALRSQATPSMPAASPREKRPRRRRTPRTRERWRERHADARRPMSRTRTLPEWCREGR